MLRALCFIPFLVVLVLAQGQDVAFVKENFPNKVKEFTVANENFIGGNIELDNADAYCKYNLYGLYCNEALPLYNRALDYYRLAYAFNPNSAELNFKMGVCFFLQDHKDSALVSFQAAQKLNPSISPALDYFIGRTNQFLQNWDTALVCLERFRENVKEKKVKLKDFKHIDVLDREIIECRAAKKMMEYLDTAVVVKNLGRAINSKHHDYSPVISKTGYSLLYTSKRPIPEISEKVADSLSLDADVYFEDIFISYQHDGVWQKHMHLNDLIRIRGDHYAVVGISDDGTSVLIYESKRGGDIYSAEYENGLWQGIAKLQGDVNSGNNEPSACYAEGKKFIYFISNRSGGEGAKDIYVSEFVDGVWGPAKNLGDLINTEFDEDGVFVTNDHQTLYFASNKPGGIGGFDIYRSIKDSTGSWGEPVNVGLPVNTPYDDIFFVLDAKERSAYFSSNRHGGFGKMDLYRADFPVGEEEGEIESIHLSADVLLKGEVPFSIEVKDAETKEPVAFDLVLMEKNTKDVLYYGHNEGKYSADILNNTQYLAKVISDGYLSAEFNFTSTVDAFLVFEKLLLKQPDTDIYNEIPDSDFETILSISEISVVDNNNAPLNNVNVTLVNLATNKTVLTKNTGNSNKMLIELIHGNEYKVSVSADGYQTAVLKLQTTELSEVFHIEAKLAGIKEKGKVSIIENKSQQSFFAKGLLYDYQTQQFRNGTVSVYDEDVLVAQAETENGKYAIALPKGKHYKVTIESEGYLAYSSVYSRNRNSAFEQIKLLNKNLAHIEGDPDLMQKTIPYEGYVSEFMTTNLLNSEVFVYDGETDSLLLQTSTDDKGYFIFALPNNKSYRFQAKADGFVSSSSKLRTSKLSKKAMVNFDLLPVSDAIVASNTKEDFAVAKVEEMFSFSGVLQDYSTKKALAGYIELYDANSGAILDTLFVDSDGTFIKQLQAEGKYFAIVKVPGYNNYTYTLSDVNEPFVYVSLKLMPSKTSLGETGSALVGTLDLSKGAKQNDGKGDVNKANGSKGYVNVHYATNAYNIKTEFKDQLIQLASMIKKQPDVTVYLNGHTDSDGSVAYNQKLSERRALAVADFLVENGADVTRIVVKGFSENKPIAKNDTPQNKYLNRRVEIVVK